MQNTRQNQDIRHTAEVAREGRAEFGAASTFSAENYPFA